MSSDANASRGPQALRDTWNYLCREHRKAAILTECFGDIVSVYGRAVGTGNVSELPDYGGDLPLVYEAMNDALRMFSEAERVLAQMRSDSYNAFNVAVQQN